MKRGCHQNASLADGCPDLRIFVVRQPLWDEPARVGPIDDEQWLAIPCGKAPSINLFTPQDVCSRTPRTKKMRQKPAV